MLKMEGVGYRAAGSPDAVLAAADLEVAPGEVRVVFGESGVGKSTLIRLLGGLTMPQSGVVFALDRDLARLREASLRRLRRRIAIIDEVPRFLERRSAFANVSVALEITALPKKKIRSSSAAALARVGLGARMDVPAHALSRSERLWLAFARALAREPEIVLADEPWRELDELGRDRLCNLIDELCAERAACLVTTGDHNMVELAELWSWGVSELRAGGLIPFHEVSTSFELADEASSAPPYVEHELYEDDDTGLADVLPFPVSDYLGGARARAGGG